jgi:hypothetical protein
LIPIVDSRAIPWNLRQVPLISNANGYPRLTLAAFLTGAIMVFALSWGFAVDYTTTRDIYFAFAIGHVLAEFPFLVKLI